MKKIINWEHSFDKFISVNKSKPFAWGSWDCCKFANSLIKEISTEDLIPKNLKWKDEETAIKAINSYGKTLMKSIAKACKNKGLYEIPILFITKGDLIVFKEESELVGICDGMNILAPSENGIELKSTELTIKAWRISDG